jgi:hypothetical protein
LPPLDPLELLELPELDEELVEPLLDELLDSPQNAFRERPHATSELPQTPSTHAAPR